MLVLLAVVVVDVYVGDPVPERFHHAVYLTGCVGMPDVKTHLHVRAFDQFVHLFRGLSQHEPERRHVLQCHGHTELPGHSVECPEGPFRTFHGLLFLPVYRH